MRLKSLWPTTTLALGGLLLVCAPHAALARGRCFYGGTMYSDGAMSCQAGRRFRCDDGNWHQRFGSCVSENVEPSHTCVFDGISFSTGSASCQAGTQYRCEDGEWASLGAPCSVGDTPIRIVPTGRKCLYEGATVSNGAAICRNGSTFACNDGEWINLGTLCR